MDYRIRFDQLGKRQHPLALQNIETHNTTLVATDVGLETGFFFRFDLTDSGIDSMLLITNKHVLQNASRLKFRLHYTLMDEDPKYPAPWVEVDVSAGLQQLINHPSDRVDLCALEMIPIFPELNREGLMPICTAFHEDQILTRNQLALVMKPAEELLMVGYPIGLIDNVNNLPIVRRGSCATHPGLDFDGDPVFLIDIPIFPGSSGSPIGCHFRRRKKEMMESANNDELKTYLAKLPDSFLLGVVESVYTYDATRGVESRVAESGQIGGQMIGIGRAIRAEEILALKAEVKERIVSAMDS